MERANVKRSKKKRRGNGVRLRKSVCERASDREKGVTRQRETVCDPKTFRIFKRSIERSWTSITIFRPSFEHRLHGISPQVIIVRAGKKMSTFFVGDVVIPESRLLWQPPLSPEFN
ncbi:MAG TPA: hypothetical protein VJB69_01295 [Candidatus Paceibacterota bacterium]